MPRHKNLEDLLPFNRKLTRSSVDKFVPLVRSQSQKYSYVCPCYLEYKFHSHSGEGRLVMGMSLINNRVKTISEEARDAIFQCFLCGGCDATMKFSTDIETMEGLYALRAESFKQVGPLAGHQRLLHRMQEVGHPLSEDGQKGDWVREAGLEAGMNGAKTLLFVGDRYALQREHRATLLNLVDLLRRGGLKLGLLGDGEPSTGRAALDIGDLERFDRHAERVASAIRGSGAQSVVCADALDFSTIRAHLPKAADLGPVKVSHAVELLDRLVAGKKINPRRPLSARVAYHDPDTLGRLSEPFQEWNGKIKKKWKQLIVYDPPREVNRGTNGVYEPPRRLLDAIPGVERVEFERCREFAFSCSDQGVLTAAGYGDFVHRTAVRRMEEAQSVGAEIIATACPSAERNLGAVAARFGIEIRNVIDLLHASVTG